VINHTGAVITTFLPSAFFATGKKPKELKIQRPESRPESLEEKILRLLKKEPHSKSQIAKKLGHKHVSSGLKKVLQNLFSSGTIIYTLPQKPNSRLQQYKLKE